MLRAALLFAFVSLGFAEYQLRCGEELGTTMKESGGDVPGRYTVEWCQNFPDAKTWQLELKYINMSDTSAPCPEHSIKNTLKYEYIIHSQANAPLQKSNCTITCLSMPLDLIFSGCYEIHNQMHGTFKGTGRTFRKDVTVRRVENQFKSVNDFNNMKPVYNIEKDSDIMYIRWDLHYIPVKNYSVEIIESANITALNYEDWIPIRDNCTEEQFSVTCRVRAPRPGRCAGALLRHAAPWRSGTLFKDANLLVHCAEKPQEVNLEPKYVDPRIWAAVGVLALLLVALAACWGVHWRALVALRRKVSEYWTRRVSSPADPPVPLEPGPILLLYARDCAPAMAAVAELRAMLDTAAPRRVDDIFSERCVAEYGADPTAWLRGKMTRRETRIVLLQTPAAAALYDTPRDDAGRLVEPLLGNVLQYRRPHYGDALLAAALRLLRASPHPHLDYTRFYVATISELECELMPELVPFRRYELPALAPTLLRDLRLPLPSPTSLVRLSTALHELRDFIRDNQDYLKEELVYLPPRDAM